MKEILNFLIENLDDDTLAAYIDKGLKLTWWFGRSRTILYEVKKLEFKFEPK